MGSHSDLSAWLDTRTLLHSPQLIGGGDHEALSDKQGCEARRRGPQEKDCSRGLARKRLRRPPIVLIPLCAIFFETASTSPQSSDCSGP